MRRPRQQRNVGPPLREFIPLATHARSCRLGAPHSYVCPPACVACLPACLARHNIGVRLIDEFLARSNTERCANFEATANLVAKVGLKMFLGINATVEKWNEAKTSCIIKLPDNPFHSCVRLACMRACVRASVRACMCA